MSLSASARSGCPSIVGQSSDDVFAEILRWWQANRSEGRASLLYAYALGKAQRLMAGLAATAGAEGGLPGPIYTHGAVETMNRAYRATGIGCPRPLMSRRRDRPWTGRPH